MADIANRIPELLETIETAFGQKAIRKETIVAAEKAGQPVLRLLRKYAPEGSVEPAYDFGQRVISHGRPSLRLGHGTLESQWGTPTIGSGENDSLNLIFESNAPHMPFLIHGTVPHRIPVSGATFLSFWWGSPLKWSSPFEPGGQIFMHVNHPGYYWARFVNFVDNALTKGKGREIITLETNLAVLYGIVDEVLKHAPKAMLLVVSNPVDVLTYAAWKRSGFKRSHVFGMAGVLDSARMASFVALETGFSVKDINAMVLGGHGDSMVPMTRFTTINGIPIEHFLSKEQIDKIVKRTREGGAEILSLRKTASAYDAPGAAVASMIDAISHNRRHILPAVAVLDGEYGLNDICMGVPCVFGEQGMEKVIELALIAQEATEFKRSSDAVRADLVKLNK